MRDRALRRIHITSWLILAGLAVMGCQKKQAAPAGAGMQGLPVQIVPVTLRRWPEQRICGYHQVAALSHAGAAGDGDADADSRPFGAIA